MEDQHLDIDHELPPSEDADAQAAELEKLRAERDSLVDRLARVQAEFDNARKRAAKEQQDFRDYALLDTIKTIIPVLDSFDRALRTSPEKVRVPLGSGTDPQATGGRADKAGCETDFRGRRAV